MVTTHDLSGARQSSGHDNRLQQSFITGCKVKHPCGTVISSPTHRTPEKSAPTPKMQLLSNSRAISDVAASYRSPLHILRVAAALRDVAFSTLFSPKIMPEFATAVNQPMCLDIVAVISSLLSDHCPYNRYQCHISFRPKVEGPKVYREATHYFHLLHSVPC